MFLVNSQNEFVPILIEETDVIANGLQVELVVEQASVHCVKMRDERMTMVIFDEVARKAAPDAFAISDPFRTLQELRFEMVAGEESMRKA